ncbi:MAG: nuclear transport factor 2 family protein [Desulfomicrobium escambiense]|nr:nuclear transport factor 2 family protein [Desulfomicrobium escambiense]
MMTFPGEIYSRGGLLTMKRVQGRWTPPAWAPFSGPNGDDDVPFFSADGKRLYFISRRPLPGETERGSERIWFTDRTPSGWGEPRPLDPNVNSVDKHWQFSLDRKGNLYFAGRPPDSRGLSDIYVARPSGGAYEKPVNMGDPINTPEIDDTPFVAPDGSYLLFSRQYDLWVSFREPDGAWSASGQHGPRRQQPVDRALPDGHGRRQVPLFPEPARRREPRLLGPRQGHRGPEGRHAAADEKAVIEKVIRDNIGWALTKDRPLAREHDGPRREPVHHQSHVRAHGRLEPARVKNFDFWMDPRFKATKCEIRDMRIGVSRSGDAAWWSCMLDDLAEWDGKPTGWKDTRWTGVLEKRDGKWLIVQMHFSFAADKVAAETKAKRETGKAGPERK